jgi:hypothetical protein
MLEPLMNSENDGMYRCEVYIRAVVWVLRTGNRGL